MTIAGSVPTTKIEALAHELRFLKSGMADLQSRLNALLGDIEGELQPAQADSEPAEAMADLFMADEPAAAEMLAAPEAEVAVAAIEVAEAIEIETPVVAEPIVETVEAAEVTQAELVAPVAIAEVATMPEALAIERVAAVERGVVETAEVETMAETPTVADAIPTVESSEPAVHVAVWAEPVLPHEEAPVAETPGQNVVVLAEHCQEAGKRRGVIAKTARWAAAIVLIATVAAVAAAGTGFAGNGELLIKSVCAVAGEGCSITLGMP
jgi:hypothetical protein